MRQTHSFWSLFTNRVAWVPASGWRGQGGDRTMVRQKGGCRRTNKTFNASSHRGPEGPDISNVIVWHFVYTEDSQPR
jgi:hypothetical protein